MQSPRGGHSPLWPVHRSSTDLAFIYSTLGLLQDDASKKHDWRCIDAPLAPRWAPKGAYPLSSPLGVDKAQVVSSNKSGLAPKPLDRRVADLKAYRHARELHDYCGEKWIQDHKCVTQGNLHVLEELYALFSTEDTVDSPATEEDEEQLCHCLSADAASFVTSVKALQFIGQIHQLPILILLDSGCSTSFISQDLVTRLSVLPVQCKPFSVTVLNGETMQCASLLPETVWTMNNYHFQHDFSILSMDHYDIILGMDWLELFSPMEVDWRQRWLAFSYNGIPVRLQGVSPDVPDFPNELLVPSDNNKATKQKPPPPNDCLVSCHTQDSNILFFIISSKRNRSVEHKS